MYTHSPRAHHFSVFHCIETSASRTLTHHAWRVTAKLNLHHLIYMNVMFMGTNSVIIKNYSSGSHISSLLKAQGRSECTAWEVLVCVSHMGWVEVSGICHTCSYDKYYTKETTNYCHLSSDKHVVIPAERSVMLGLCNAKGEWSRLPDKSNLHQRG